MTIATTNIAHRFATAFHTRDVEQVVQCFTPDVTYHDIFYGPFHGSAGIRELFGRMYAEGDHHEWTMHRTAADGPDRTLVEWTFTFTISQAVRIGAGRTLRFPGISVYETTDGRCHTYREYFDRAAVLLAADIPPATVAALVTRRSNVQLLPGDRSTAPAP